VHATSLFLVPLTGDAPAPPRSRMLTDEEIGPRSLAPSLEAITDALAAAEPGGPALVAAPGADGGIDHVYVAVVDEAGVSYLDPQAGTLAALPENTTALALPPIAPGIPAPLGGRLLTAEEVASPVVVPESVGLMARQFDRVSRSGVSREDVPIRLVAERFPAGLRLAPMEEAETVGAADWVRERLDDRTKGLGMHAPANWAAFRELIDRAGEDGLVLPLPEAGRASSVYMKSDDLIWQIHAGRDGTEAREWTEPPALPIGVEQPPRWVLVFNKCADFLL
jgi:hypothetical protein